MRQTEKLFDLEIDGRPAEDILKNYGSDPAVNLLIITGLDADTKVLG